MRNGVTEKELIEKATGERVTLESIEASIVGEHYFTAADGVAGAELHSRLDKAIDAIQVWPQWRTATYGRPTSLNLLTICVLTLWNGWTILGKSGCADPANFDEDLGRRLARTDAVNQIWPLMGFELKSKLVRASRAERPEGAQRPKGNAEGAGEASA